MARDTYPNRDTWFGGENWSDEWPKEAEAGCLAACFADGRATDSAAKVTGLGHAYLSVAANEGILIFNLFLLFGASLGGLSIWLTIHVIQTEELVLIIPLIPAFVLTLYCWAFLGLKYRLRRLLFEVVLFCCRWPFTAIRKLASSASTIPLTIYSIPGFMMAGRYIIRPPRYRGNVGEKGPETAVLCFACRKLTRESQILTGSKMPLHLVKSTENWQHHSLRGLQESAGNCHLCRLLLQSTTAQSSMEPAENQVELEKQEKEPKTNLTVLQERATTVRVWQDKSSAGDSGLKMQLHGGDVQDARPLEILEVHDRKPPTSIQDRGWPRPLRITNS